MENTGDYSVRDEPVQSSFQASSDPSQLHAKNDQQTYPGNEIVCGSSVNGNGRAVVNVSEELISDNGNTKKRKSSPNTEVSLTMPPNLRQRIDNFSPTNPIDDDMADLSSDLLDDSFESRDNTLSQNNDLTLNKPATSTSASASTSADADAFDDDDDDDASTANSDVQEVSRPFILDDHSDHTLPTHSIDIQEDHDLNSLNLKTTHTLSVQRDGSELTLHKDTLRYMESMISKIEHFTRKIFYSSASAYPLEELYKIVENLCRLGIANELHANLLNFIKLYLDERLTNELNVRLSHTDVDFLTHFLSTWKQYQNQLFTLRLVYSFLEQCYIPQNQLPSLYADGIELFRVCILDKSIFLDKLISAACNQFNLHRNGLPCDLHLFHEFIKVLLAVKHYSPTFESVFLANSRQFFQTWVDGESREFDTSRYSQKAATFIQDEISRCLSTGLQSSTYREIYSMLDNYLILKQYESMVDYGVMKDLFDKFAQADLSQLYKLLDRCKLTGKLRDPFARWISEVGHSIIVDPVNVGVMVPRLIRFKKKLDEIWSQSFHRNSELGACLRESFAKFVNRTGRGTCDDMDLDGNDRDAELRLARPAEMIARYLDQLLQHGAQVIPVEIQDNPPHDGTNQVGQCVRPTESSDDTSERVSRQLDLVLDLFRMVNGKSVFEAFYQRDLARRLLLDCSWSVDAELSLIERLKSECGSQFTENLERMFKDITSADDIANSFYEWMKDKATGESLNESLYVRVLSSESWPTYPDTPVNLPLDIRAATAKFEEFYRTVNPNRLLTWKQTLSHCLVEGHYAAGQTRQFILSSLQACVLDIFNIVDEDDSDKSPLISYARIQQVTGLADSELQQTLRSLYMGKIQLLEKVPMTPAYEIDPGIDSFRINESLPCQHTQELLRVNQPQISLTSGSGAAALLDEANACTQRGRDSTSINDLTATGNNRDGGHDDTVATATNMVTATATNATLAATQPASACASEAVTLYYSGGITAEAAAAAHAVASTRAKAAADRHMEAQAIIVRLLKWRYRQFNDDDDDDDEGEEEGRGTEKNNEVADSCNTLTQPAQGSRKARLMEHEALVDKVGEISRSRGQLTRRDIEENIRKLLEKEYIAKVSLCANSEVSTEPNAELESVRTGYVYVP